MTANDIDQMLKATGLGDYRDPPWDQILCGDGDTELTGIAVCWRSTLDVLHEAARLGCNLLVTHEPLYRWDEVEGFRHEAEAAKAAFLEGSGLTVYRCHDVWDVMPKVGIPDAWATFLGFDGQPAATAKFLRAFDLPDGATLGSVAADIVARVKELRQQSVGMIGKADQPAHRIAIGTGAITPYRDMAALGADVLLLTDDGTRTWESAQWAIDTGVGVLLVNHATAEEPGMRQLARWLADRVDVPVHHLPCGCLYDTVGVE
jgi:putative NIF3 family GTP cyclohydrolase 1 type 2